MQIAAAAPFWAWTDLAYSLLPNGRTLDYASNNAYRGPFGTAPYGVSKTTYVIQGLQPGTYYFKCDVHPGMNGKFVVK